MAISHELSGEIAAALFAAKERSLSERHDLKEIVFEIHSTLEQLSDGARVSGARDNRHAPLSANLPAVKSNSAGKES